MAKQSAPAGPTKSGQTRAERQKALLKANMARRKAQARARSAQDTTDNEGKGPATRGE
jgi:type II secretory pathway pseudopilin PulG